MKTGNGLFHNGLFTLCEFNLTYVFQCLDLVADFNFLCLGTKKVTLRLIRHILTS